MKDIQKNTTKTWITYGLTGFLLGVCIIFLTTIGLIAYQTTNPLPTQTPFPTPTLSTLALLDQAYRALNVDRDPQLVLDILGPHLEEFKDPNDLGKALEYLGGAELGLGHYQLAAVYYERLVQLSPTPQNYFILARIYDTSGDLENALKYILLYLQSDDPALTDDLRTMLQDRANQIQTVLTSSTPTVTQ